MNLTSSRGVSHETSDITATTTTSAVRVLVIIIGACGTTMRQVRLDEAFSLDKTPMIDGAVVVRMRERSPELIERLGQARGRDEPLPRPHYVAPRPSISLNTGMHLRRMRRSSGLARART